MGCANYIRTPSRPSRPAGRDRLQRLAEQLSRSEPEIPSIAISLAHEDRITAANGTEREEEPTLARAGDQDITPIVERGNQPAPLITDGESTHQVITPNVSTEPRRSPADADRNTTPRSAEPHLEPEPEPGWEM
jgi:hypothetical protein